MNSGHKVEIVPVVLEKHPNADKLSIIRVFGYTCVVNTEQWTGVDKAAFIPPDTLVDTKRPEFSFLFNENATFYWPDGVTAKQELRKMSPTHIRIRAKKLRGVVSYGLLIPAPEGANIGDNVAEQLEVIHWNPPEPESRGPNQMKTGGEAAKGPAVYSPKYDVDSFQRYAKEVFNDGELVIATEKIHGANGRWVFHNGEFYCGSRTEWKKEFATPPNVEDIEKNLRAKLEGIQTPEEIESRVAAMKEKTALRSSSPAQNMWWKALRQYPDMMRFLETYPDVVVYGEVYGQVQDLKYGTKPGEVRIAVFDILTSIGWISSDTARAWAPQLPWVPVVADNFPFDFDKLVDMAEGQSLIVGANHIKEGIVVKPLVERHSDICGRVQLKIVSPSYLER